MGPVEARLSVVGALVGIRKAQHLTQSQVAERMGVAQSTVSGFETSSDPRISTMQRYARAVGCVVGFEAPHDLALEVPLTEGEGD